MAVKNNNKTARGKNRRAGNVTESAAEQRARLARSLGLKAKSKAVLDELIDNPKISKTDAYIKHHKTTSRKTAGSEVAKLTAKPSAKIYSDAALGKAKRRVVELVDSNNEQIALKAAQDVIDRREGKAVQKNETLSRVVEVKLDLTGMKLGSHYIQAPEQAALTSQNT